ncbi:MAG: NAD(P)-dependent oxidoreductase [Leptolyngbyaceae cyanobacterium SL_7_1]|nr:NAD(P)-dependent oxidoreductase [Leptolyngbyaceae cyanobacterium SL_7_1]
MTRILLLGASGQLGQQLCRTLSRVGTVIVINRATLDLCQPHQIPTVVLPIQPDLLINAAAYNAVDRAETEVSQADAVNAIAPAVLAEVAKTLTIPLIHFSTNYVFDGESTTPYDENDVPNPINAYGRSKLSGEIHIRQTWERHLILRTAWLYGIGHSSNFLNTICGWQPSNRNYESLPISSALLPLPLTLPMPSNP